jgi:hypothetical protein
MELCHLVLCRPFCHRAIRVGFGVKLRPLRAAALTLDNLPIGMTQRSMSAALGVTASENIHQTLFHSLHELYQRRSSDSLHACGCADLHGSRLSHIVPPLRGSPAQHDVLPDKLAEPLVDCDWMWQNRREALSSLSPRCSHQPVD